MGISNPQKKQKTPLGLGGEACDLSETARQRWHEPPWNTDGGFKTRYLFLLDFMAYFHKNPLYFWGVQNIESLYFWGVILFFIPIFFQQMFAGVWVGRNTSRVPNLAPILGCPKTEVDGSMGYVTSLYMGYSLGWNHPLIRSPLILFLSSDLDIQVELGTSVASYFRFGCMLWKTKNVNMLQVEQILK